MSDRPLIANTGLPEEIASDSSKDGPGRVARLAYLDGWRGLAVIALLAGHFFELPAINFGRVGVELFFVLSGRLMAEILFVNRQPVMEFFRRRVARLWPALAFYVILAWAVLPPVGRLHAADYEAFSCLTFSSNYFVPGGPTSVLGHTWSLCVEEHAYLVLAGLAMLASRISTRVAFVALAVACACMLNGAVRSEVFDSNYRAVYVKTDVRVASIFLGCALYLLLRKPDAPAGGAAVKPTTETTSVAPTTATTGTTTIAGPRPSSTLTSLMPLGFAAAGLMLNMKTFPDSIKYSLGSACLAVAVCTIDRLPPRVLRMLGHPVLVMMGLWSYSIYLWQQPFYKLSGQLSAKLEGALADFTAATLLLILSMACALVSFYAIERPARRWLNRRWSIPPKRAGASGCVVVGTGSDPG